MHRASKHCYYLDNNATTKPDPYMLKMVLDEVSNNYGNPSSSHLWGQNARETLAIARHNVANALNADHNVYFTSGGTEANNLVIQSAIQSGYQVAISAVEHSSIAKIPNINAVLPVNGQGLVDIGAVEYFVRNNNKPFVSIMMANNETGVLPYANEEIADIKNLAGDFIFHSDAVQVFGKEKIDLKNHPADVITVSAHKAHGLRGAGAIISNKKFSLIPCWFGGSHEYGVRPGTENMAGILSLAYVSKQSLQSEKIQQVRDSFEQRLSNLATVNGNSVKRICNTSNLSFYKVVDFELFLDQLSQRGIMASAGSACNSGMSSHSKVLAAMYGSNSKRLESSIRFSFSKYSDLTDIQDIGEIIEDALDEHGKITSHARRENG